MCTKTEDSALQRTHPNTCNTWNCAVELGKDENDIHQWRKWTLSKWKRCYLRQMSLKTIHVVAHFLSFLNESFVFFLQSIDSGFVLRAQNFFDCLVLTFFTANMKVTSHVIEFSEQRFFLVLQFSNIRRTLKNPISNFEATEKENTTLHLQMCMYHTRLSFQNSFLQNCIWKKNCKINYIFIS